MKKSLVELGLIAVILAYGSLIFSLVVQSFNLTAGMDVTLQTHFAQMASNNLPFYLWDAFYYSGQPMIGFSSSVFIPMIVMLKLGVDLATTFFYSFWFYFLAFGLSLYYLAKQLSPSRLVALCIPFIAWASTTWWDATIWGGSYDRAFALPFLFTSLALTYKYISQGDSPSKKLYFLTLFMWVMVFFANEHITFQFLMLAPLMVIFAYDKLKTGIKRTLILLLPAMAITSFAWLRLASYMLATPYLSFQNNLTLYPLTLLFSQGGLYEHAAGVLPVPIIIILCVIIVMKYAVSKVEIEPPRRGLFIALAVAGAYYLAVGWIPQLWPFLPRLEAVFDDIANIWALFLIAIPALFGLVIPVVASRKTKMYVRLGVTALFIVVLANTALVIPTIQNVYYPPVNPALDNTLASLGAYQPDYRLNVIDGNILNGVNYAHPQVEDVAGRIPILDSRPLYDSWFEDVVFYGGANPATLNTFPQYVPPIYESYFSSDIRNTAPSLFWLDWEGVKDTIFTQYTAPVLPSAAVIEAQSFFNTSTTSNLIQRDVNLQTLVFSSSTSGTIAEQTNAKILGVYGTDTEYNLILTLLSYAGLGPSYVIPLKLDASQIDRVIPDVLLMDKTLAGSGMGVVTVTQDELQNWVNLGPTGSYDFIQRFLPSLISNDTVATANGTTTFPTLTVPLANPSIENASVNPFTQVLSTTVIPQPVGYLYQLPNTVAYTPNTFLRIDIPNTGTETPAYLTLAVGTSNSSAGIIGVPVEIGTSIIPLTMLSGKTSEFNQIITSSPVTSVSIASFIQPSQQPLTHVWQTGNSGMINGITSGFRGVIFKETYYPNWEFTSGMQVYYAGPGMMYIPLSVGITSIGFSFNAYDWITLTGIVLAAVTTVALAFWVVTTRRKEEAFE